MSYFLRPQSPIVTGRHGDVDAGLLKPHRPATMATPHTYSDDQLFIGPVEFI